MLFPRSMKKEFGQMRVKFVITFQNVRLLFSTKKLAKSQNVVSEMKATLTCYSSDFKPELSHKKTIKGILDVVERKCTIIDVHPLELLTLQFKVKEAEKIIREYKEAAKEFCKSVSVSLSKDETLQAISTRYLLCETITFVLNWNPDKTTLQDVKDVLMELELLQKYEIKVVGVGPGRSVVVTCYCPAEFISSLTMSVFHKIDMLQKRGLKEYIVGNCVIWSTPQVRYT